MLSFQEATVALLGQTAPHSNCSVLNIFINCSNTRKQLDQQIHYTKHFRCSLKNYFPSSTTATQHRTTALQKDGVRRQEVKFHLCFCLQSVDLLKSGWMSLC